MPNWTESMQQTYEYYKVDPSTWTDSEKIDSVLSCSITNDSSAETLGSASFELTEPIEECYVRTYMVTIQNGSRERFCLGTHLLESPSISFDGYNQSNDVDGYTPLIELKESYPGIGYFISKEKDAISTAYELTKDNLRAPVIENSADNTYALADNFVANTSDTWLSFISDLLSTANYTFSLDEYGSVMFSPVQDIASLNPIWTYTDDNSSILLPDIEDERDLYGVPNVVEVIYSSEDYYIYSRVENSSKGSKISTVNRGREIVYRDTNPSLTGVVTQTTLDQYAKKLLRNLSCLEHTVTYTHGYCPVRVGDCVRLNYSSSGLGVIKAKVTSQTISCVSGCTVEETAVYTEQLWED